jgi:hypothetical protein
MWIFAIGSAAGSMAMFVMLILQCEKTRELKVKLESQRQKREIDEGKRVALRTALDAAEAKIQTLEVAVNALEAKDNCPKHALQILTAIVTAWEGD